MRVVEISDQTGGHVPRRFNRELAASLTERVTSEAAAATSENWKALVMPVVARRVRSEVEIYIMDGGPSE